MLLTRLDCIKTVNETSCPSIMHFLISFATFGAQRASGLFEEEGENEYDGRRGSIYPRMSTPCCQSGRGKSLRRAGDCLRGEKGPMWDPTPPIRDFATVWAQSGSI